MKNLIVVLLVTLSFLGLESCCKDGLFAGNDQLPPETTTGANTAGCLVNGEVFIPHQRGLSPALQCNYEFIDSQFYFNLHLSDLRGTGIKGVVVQSRKITLAVGQTYILNKNTTDNGDFFGGGAVFDDNLTNVFNTTILKTGELKITRIDLQNSIISGTFWFDAINNSTNETIKIRSGRFDMHY